jgi:hypothetical protein
MPVLPIPSKKVYTGAKNKRNRKAIKGKCVQAGYSTKKVLRDSCRRSEGSLLGK